MRSTLQLGLNPRSGVSDLEGPTVLRVRKRSHRCGAGQGIAARDLLSHTELKEGGHVDGLIEEAVDDEVSPTDAVEWFVANGAGEEPDSRGVRRWEVWVARPGNNSDYVSIVEMERELRLLPPPRRESRQVLVQDVISEAACVFEKDPGLLAYACCDFVDHSRGKSGG